MALLRSPTSSRWECTAVALILALGLILSVPHIDDTLRKPPSRSLEVSQADGRRTDTSAPQPSMAQRNVPTNLSQAPGTVRPKIDRSPKPVAGTRVDCAVPAVTETPIASTAGVAHVAWTPDELVQCLQNGIGQSGAGGIDVVGLGDSHSRKAFESLSDRLPESKRAFIQRRVIPKRKHGDLVGIGGAVPIPADPKPREGEFRVYNTFGARVGRTAIMEPEFPWRGKVSRAQRQSHVLITRGAWDLQRLNSSLRTIHDDIISALTTVAAWKDVASITFRTVHPVAGEVPKLRGRCQRRELATVVRAVGACAVARYMRGDKARKPGRKVTVLDLWDFGLRAGRGGYSDFQHFGGSTNAASADLFLRMGVCPGQPHPVLNASNDNGGVWWSSDVAAIEQRFKCDLAFPLTAKPTDDITAGPVMIGEWDVKYGTAQDVGCMCDIPNLGDNDRCAILLGTRIPYADFLSSALVYRTICDALQRPASERWRVALSSEHLDSLRLSDRQPAPPWFAALISSVCLAPNRGEVAYAKAFAVNPSCDPRSPGGGGDLTKEQMNLLRRLRDVRDTLAPPPAADRQLRSVNASTSVLSCSEAPLWDTVLRVVCQPIWLGEQSIKLASLVPADASVQRWLAIASSKLASKRSL